MLQIIRDKITGIVFWVIFAIIGIAFLSIGVGNFSNNSVVLAKVNGQSISKDYINSIYNSYLQQQIAKGASEDINPKKIKQQILQDLINELALVSELKKAGFTINNDQIVEAVMMAPQFSDNGKFSITKYKKFLQQFSLSEEKYQQILSEKFLLDQFRDGVVMSSFMLPEQVKATLDMWEQTRNFGYAVLPADRFMEQVQVNEQQVVDYYKQHQDDFMHPEKVKISYVELKSQDLQKAINPSEQELEEFYNEHVNYYTTPDVIKIQHILIAAAKGSPTEISGEARAKAEDVLAKLKLGEDFTKLASKYSDDQSSAKQGGQLGWIGKGELEPVFEQAAFSLTTNGEISEVVQTDFGYHIIRREDRKISKINSFAEALDAVKEHYINEQAALRLNALTEELTSLAAENSESLATIAEQLNLPLQHAGPFTSEGSDGIAAYKVVLAAAFNQEHQHKNSDLLKLADDRYVIIRVTDRQAAYPKRLPEVQEQIKHTLQTEQAQLLAGEMGAKFADEVQSTGNPNAVAAKYNIEWRVMEKVSRSSELPQEILKAVFTLPKATKYKALTLQNGNFAFIKLVAVNAPKKYSMDQDKMAEQLAGLRGQLESKLYEQELISHAKIKKFKTDEL